MWLAHALTLSRIPLAGAFWATYGDRRWSALWLALAALSDGLDGWAARRARPEGSALGAWLDPIADKIFVAVVLIAIVVHDHPAPWLIALIGAREVVLVPLGLAYRIALVARPGWSHDFRAGALGKLATVAQFVAIALLLLHSRWTVVAAAVAAGAGLGAIASYARRALTTRT